MALMKTNVVPRDAVIMDEEEATRYVWDLVGEWQNNYDTWALRYAPAILGGINAVSGILINKHFRDKLKLGTYGYLASVIPISLMPGLLTSLFHRHLISTEVLLMKKNCPICYEVRSAAVQWTFGVAYPMVLGSTSAMMFASRYCTYRVPNLSEGPKVIFQFLRKITRPFNGTLVALSTIQILASSVLTHFQMKNNINIRTKLLEIEKKAEQELGTEF